MILKLYQARLNFSSIVTSAKEVNFWIGYYPSRAARAGKMISVGVHMYITVESPNKGHFGTNINSSGLSTV